ncbi:MAG: hypothetical protein IJT75_04090 [Bacteroidaceae bacterium]|nr:hypothetical protein [Bacteroidaceae bacterium]
MKSRRQILWGMLGGMVLAGLTACSGDDATDVPNDDGVKVRRITITQTEAAAQQAPTRASLTEDDGLTASWTAGDALTYCNLSRVDYGNNEAPYSGGLTAASTAAASQFTGDVACRAGDYLAVVYPATTFEYNDRYTISLTGQDGTLNTLATNYHYVFGKATVTAVTGATATATMEKMKSLLTVCKFSFVDKDGGAAIPVKTLGISYGGSGSDNGTYPPTATVSLKDADGVSLDQADVHATGATGTGALTVTCSTAQDAVYVALLPTAAARTFSFSVSDGSGNSYTGTAKATLTEGEYVAAEGLKLTKQ